MSMSLLDAAFDFHGRNVLEFAALPETGFAACTVWALRPRCRFV
jgi:hypothetical protein